MEKLLTSLVSAVDEDPRGLRPAQAIQHFLSYCLGIIRGGDEDTVADLAQQTAAAAHLMQSKELDSDELWRAWYAGQTQAVAALSRLFLRSEIPGKVRRAILPSKNAASILLALQHGDELNQSELREKTAIQDASQLSKQVASLREIGVVDVAKEGRNSWVRLTSLGRRIVSTPALHAKLLERVESEASVAEAVAAEGERGVAFGAPPGEMVGAPEDDTLRIRLSRPTPTGVALPQVPFKVDRPAKRAPDRQLLAPDD